MTQELRTSVRVAAGGRIVIPLEVRARLGWEVGSELVLTVEDDHATLMNAQTARHRAHTRVARYIAGGASLSAELMAERKQESKSE